MTATQLGKGLPRLEAQRRLILLIVASAALQGLLLIPVPLVIRDIFDNAIPNKDGERLVVATLGLVVLVTMSGAVSVVLRHFTLRIVQRHLADVRRAIGSVLVAAPMTSLRRRSHEEIRDLAVQDVLRYSSTVSMVTAEVLPSALTGGAVALVLLALDPALFIVSALLMLPLVGFNRLLGRGLGRDTENYHHRFGQHSAGIVRMLRRAPVTRVHGAQHLELTQHDRLVIDLESSAVQLDKSRSLYGWALQSVIVGSALIILLIGGLGVINGTRSLGELFAFYAAIALIRPALDVVVQVAPYLTEGRQAHARLEDLASMDTEDVHTGSRAIDFSGQIVAENLSFSYDDRLILDGLNFRLEPGTVTVLRGPNGSGKTTLVRLLCGLLEPTQGTILADGVAYNDLDRSTLRRSIGVVFQESLLGGQSIEEAMAFGDHEVTGPGLAEAFSSSQFDRVLERLPEGTATPLREEGSDLSGGERQRLAIAQALVRSPRLLLLDEPTNHLDAQAVAAVVGELIDRPNGPAVLVVTHEDSRRFQPDQIINLSDHSSTVELSTTTHT